MSQAAMELPTPTLDVVLKGINELQRAPDPKKRIKVEMTLPEPDVKKLHAWMNSDQYEKAEEIRKADLAKCTKSLEHCVNFAMREYGSGAEVIAKVLVSLYNSHIVKVGLWDDLRSLDRCNFEHCMNVIRLCFSTNMEPHDYFQNGGELFQAIIKRHGLKKGARS